MSVVDKIKKWMNPSDYSYDDPQAEDDTRSDEASSDYESSYSAKRRGVVNINNNNSLNKVILTNPGSYAEITTIGDHLKNREAIVLNLESAPKAECRRILDFVSGATYVLGGNFKRVANLTFLVTPGSVDISGDILLDEFGESGFSL